MFFGKFNKIQYNGKTVTDITNSILLKYRPIKNTTLYHYHIVKEGETPESLAYDYYGNASDHWVILLMNNIIDPFFGWVMSTNEITALIRDKYGETRGEHIHHLYDTKRRRRLDSIEQAEYVDSNGKLFRTLPTHIHPVTNTDYEISLNNERRTIKILSPKYLQDFKNDFEDLMNR